MTAGLEADAVEKWLYATLSGDATLRAAVGASGSVEFVFEGAQPQSSNLSKAVVYQFLDGEDVAVVGAQRIFSSLLYLVKGVSDGEDYASLALVVTRLDVLLDRQQGTNAHGEVWGCYRVQPFRDTGPQFENGQPYRQSGGQYRLYAT